MSLISIYVSVLLFCMLSWHIHLFFVFTISSHFSRLLCTLCKHTLNTNSVFSWFIHVQYSFCSVIWFLIMKYSCISFSLSLSDGDHILLICSFFEGLFLVFIHSTAFFPIFTIKGMNNRLQSSHHSWRETNGVLMDILSLTFLCQKKRELQQLSYPSSMS